MNRFHSIRAGALLLAALVTLALPTGCASVRQWAGLDRYPLTLDQMRVRDPYVYPDQAHGLYYLYARLQNRINGQGDADGFECYVSRDLVHWSEPRMVFTPPEGFWGTQDYWAPEMHEYQGKYYLFASFYSKNANRGTQVLVADAPDGPFRPFGNAAFTPAGWMALDGTLWVEQGRPWMVFCHEWVQVGDGEVAAMPLQPDLSAPDGPPQRLFQASEAPWVRAYDPARKQSSLVTDGPFLYRTRTGALLMLWSSFGDKGYAVGVARSQSGSVLGPWTHDPAPLFAENGGHAMLFRTLDGRLMLSLHQPNTKPDERPQFFEMEEAGDTLRLKP